MTPAAAAFSVGARTAGIVIALGYLLGFVEGPVVIVMGGLGLVALGRTMLLARRDALLAGVAFAVLAGAVGVAGLRWGALELASLRGAQAVLGPTVLVGPTVVATAAWGAGIAALAAAGLWLSRPRPGYRVERVRHWVEVVVAALGIATAFWGPALPRGAIGTAALGGWTVAVTAVAAVAGTTAVLLARTGVVIRAVVVGVAGVMVVGAAAAVTGTL